MKVSKLLEILQEVDDEAELELATNEIEAMLLQGKSADNYVYHQSFDDSGKIKKVLTLF